VDVGGCVARASELQNVATHCYDKQFIHTSTLSTLRATPTTLSPFFVSSAAMAAPMPLLAPVTTATRPDQRSILLYMYILQAYVHCIQ
jgi:hypothetical protein